MEMLIAGCLAFALTHLGVSGTPLRGPLLRLLGDMGYVACYSLIAIGAFAVMLYGYGQASHEDFVWQPSAPASWVAKGMLLVAVPLLVMGLLVKNPTQVMMGSTVGDDLAGLLKITRHPIQWSIMIFAIAHLLANGDVASLWLFGTLLFVSFFGALSMDARRRKETDPKWKKFMAGTSFLPFHALLAGKARLAWSELNWLACLLGLAVYALLYWLHGPISGGASLL